MDAIQDSLIQLQNMFTQRMDIYQGELHDAAPTANIANLSSEFASFRLFIMTSLRNLQDQVSLLAHQTDNMEMRSRRKILLLHGVPECNKEDITAAAVQIVVDRMKITGFSTNDVSRCQRIGRISKDKPRPILLKLREIAVKNKVWYAKKNLKGTGITLSEFLTKARHNTFMAARQKFGVSKCWTHEGIIYFLGDNGVRRRAVCLADLEKTATLDKINEPQVSKLAVSREPIAAAKSRRVGNANKK